MPHIHSRAALLAVALTLPMLVACTDDPAATAPSIPARPSLAAGAVITVTNKSGGTDIGSLRWAVGIATGGEIIRFDPSLARDTITIDTTVVIYYPLIIEGPRDGVTISANRKSRVIHSATAGTTTLRNLNIILGEVKPTESQGAGIFATGGVVLENTALFANIAQGISAIYVNELTMRNSTVAGNVSYDFLAAVVARAKFTLINSTIANNIGTGITRTVGSTLQNSIIAGHGVPNCEGTAALVYQGKNLADDDSCGDLSVMLIGDAKLGTLADNGGPSATIALGAQSPALDAGTGCTVTTDQRYVARDAQCDLGAFEFIDFTKVTLTVDPAVAVNQANGWAVVTGTVTCSRAESISVSLVLKQEQKSARKVTVVEANGSTPVACSTTPRPFSASLVPASGQFAIGNGTVTAATVAPKWVTPAASTATVRLYNGHK